MTGDAKTPLSFAMGVLSSTMYGNYCVYTGGLTLDGVGKVLNLHKDSFLVLDSDLA